MTFAECGFMCHSLNLISYYEMTLVNIVACFEAQMLRESILYTIHRVHEF